MKALDPHVREEIVQRNLYLTDTQKRISLPTLESIQDMLPQPFWDGHESALRCWNKVWALAIKNVMNPAEGTRFVSPFIDTAFNGCLFLWDSSFILMFARYGARAHDFQQTLNNFYAHQHEDGFISREIQESDSLERFARMDYSSTGPNILAWCEWEYYQNFGDLARLERVFPALLGYHNWMRNYRSWPDGAYWTTGWGCGMDNCPRCPEGFDHVLHHGFMGWIDATAQALLSARCLIRIAEKIGWEAEVNVLRTEADSLERYINENMWNEKTGCYSDRLRDGRISDVIHIGAFWAILAGAATAERAEKMLDLLEDPKHFNRPHRVPSLSASDRGYDNASGDYWRGAVWAPTNYMVLRGLRRLGTDRARRLARQIGRNHHDNVMKVFEDTGTVWENYAPETAAPGKPAKPDFVGWSGLGPVAVFLEEVFGLQPDVANNRLVWEISLTEAFGVHKYPFGSEGLFSLSAQARCSPADEPVIRVEGNVPLHLHVKWDGGSRDYDFQV